MGFHSRMAHCFSVVLIISSEFTPANNWLTSQLEFKLHLRMMVESEIRTK
jgi:hypothetical protein